MHYRLPIDYHNNDLCSIIITIRMRFCNRNFYFYPFTNYKSDYSSRCNDNIS